MKTRLLPAGLLAAAFLASPAFAAPPPVAHPEVHQAAPPRASGMNASPMRAGLYRRAQIKLKQMNFYHGPVDGIRNAAYVRALESYQHRHHLHVTGRLNEATRASLGIA